MSNLYDARLVAMPAYRQQMASCILQAVQNYRRAVGTQLADVAVRSGSGDGPRVERSLITSIMHRAGGNQTNAADMLGLNRNTLRSKLSKYNIR